MVNKPVTAEDPNSYKLNTVQVVKRVPDEESPLMSDEDETRQYVVVTIFFSITGAVLLVATIMIAVMYSS